VILNSLSIFNLSIINKPLKTKKMKKQLLILIVAIFAISFSNAIAQTPFDPPTCIATALTPAPGQQYNYQVTVSGPGYAGTGNYRWYVTSDPNLITGAVIPNDGSFFTATGAGAYNLLAGGGGTIDITWTSAALAAGVPYYLVIRYEEANSTATPSCNAMNMKVYRIVPMNTFWLKIESVADGAGAPGGVEQCAANITGALVTGATVEYTYGVNVLYVKITASGYVGNWTPTLRISNCMDDQSIGAAGITWTSGALNGTFTGGAGPFGNGDYTSSAPMPSTIAGSVIIVTIPINNNHHQALADQSIAVAIDGSYISGATTFNDLSDVNGPCTPETPFADAVNKIIKARPTVNPVAPNTFVNDPLTKP
jgi:hypothetical protein